MRHIFTFTDGTEKVFEEDGNSTIIVSTNDFPLLGAMPGMFKVTFSDDRMVHIPFDNVKAVVTLPADRDESPL
jgi:hypothetical protein